MTDPTTATDQESAALRHGELVNVGGDGAEAPSRRSTASRSTSRPR